MFLPKPSGGRVQYGATGTWTSLTRKLSSPLNFNVAGQYFLSFLIHNYCDYNAYSAAANDDNRVFLGDSVDGTRIYMGRDLNGTNVITMGNSTTAPWDLNRAYCASPWEGCNANFMIFVAARIQTDWQGGVTVNVKHYYYDPVDGWGAVVDTNPNSASWDATLSGVVTGQRVFDQLGISAAGTDYEEVDEIRLGTTWTDVTDTITPTNTVSTGMINVALGPVNPLGAYAGAGPVAGSSGDYWNPLSFGITTDGTRTSSPQTSGPLYDSGGRSTAVTLQVGTNTADQLEWNMASGGNFGGNFSWLVSETVSFFTPDALIVRGLDNTKAYNVYCFTGPWGGFSQCELTVGEVTNHLQANQAWITPWEQGCEYCIFTNVPTDGSGNLVINIGLDNANRLQEELCGFQIEAVPVAIVTQPQSQMAPPGSTVRLSIATTGGSGPAAYRWQENVNGTFVNLSNSGNVSGTTANVLTITNVQTTNAGSYRALVTVGGLVTNSSSATITVQTGVLTDQLTMDTTTVLRNPFTCLALYANENQFAQYPSNYMQNAGQFWRQVSAPQAPYASTLYLRVLWSYMEPQEGVYVWNTDTNFMALCQGAWDRGLRVAFRIYVNSGDNNELLATPQWAFNAGVPQITDPGSGLPDPDITSPVFQTKYEAFIDAFAAKFNDPAKVMFVDASTFGSWGEMNVSDQSLNTAQLQQTMTWLMTTWTNALTRVPLLMNYPGGTWSPAQYAAWCFDTGCAGMRRDGLGSGWVPLSDETSIRAGWPQMPFVAENASYLTSPADQVYFLSQRLYLHANISDSCIPVFAKLFDLWGGYRFVVNSVSYPGAIAPNSNAVLQATVQNWGVGVLPNNLRPWNHKYKFAYALLDPTGNPVTTIVDTALADDPSNWTNGTAYNPPNAGGIPTDIMENYWQAGNSQTYTLRVTNNFGAVAAGSYYLGVAVVDTSNNNHVDIALANTAPRTPSGWTLVGPVVVVSSPLTITTQPQPPVMTNYAGNQVNYSVLVLGSSLSYQWYQGPSPINGATNSAYTATTLTGTNTYSVVVSGAGGSVTSSVVTLVGQVFSRPASGFVLNFNQVGPSGAYHGLGAFADLPANTTWNALPAAGSISAAASTSAGSPTLATFSISGNNNNAALYGSSSPSNPCFLLGAFTLANSGPFALNFSFNTVPPGVYNLYCYAQNGAWGGRGGVFALTGGTAGSADRGILGATNATGSNCSLAEGVNCVLFTNVVPDATGKISVMETGVPQSTGEIDFNGAQLVWAGTAPVITSQPQSQIVPQAATVQLNVVANGNPVPAYQWKKNNASLVDGGTGNGSTLSGSTSSVLTIVTARTNDSGTYTVGITNAAGGTNSAAAQLLVVAPATSSQAPWLTNRSNAGQFQFSFGALPGYRYLMQRTTNLGPSASWLTLSNLPPAFSNYSFNFGDGFTNPAAFYRAVMTNQ